VQSKKSFLTFFYLLFLCSCGDRDLTRNFAVENTTSESALFNFRKDINGYTGLLNFENFETFRVDLNLTSGRLSLSNSSEGLIDCSAELCSVEWFAPPGPDDVLISNQDFLKRNYNFTIKTEDVDFFVNQAPPETSTETMCDASFGDVQIGTKTSISLTFKDKIISESLIFELGAPNNTASLPVFSDGSEIKRDARYYLDFDGYFSGESKRFQHAGSRRSTAETSFFMIDAGHPTHSKNIRVCTNDN
jgi:hypothetical protein